MSNSINTLSPDFRDFLLLKNLVADTIVENGLSSLLNGVGKPTSIETIPIAVQQGDGVSGPGQIYQEDNTILNKYQGGVNDYNQVVITYNNSSITNQTGPYNYTQANVVNVGDLFRPQNTIYNLYNDEEKQTLVNLNTISTPIVDNFTSYLDENGNLNIGGPSTQPLDILSGVLNGQGVGFNVTDGSLISNGDIRASLGGRILGAAGIINDTNLGKIGAQQLLTHVGYNAAFGLQQETIGNLNLNPLTLLQGRPLVTLNYQITTPKNKVGKVLNFAANVFGVQSPLSLLQDSIFSFGDKGEYKFVSNVEMANEMIKNSGRGQVQSLFNNLRANSVVDNPNITTFRQGYRPGYDDSRDRTDDGLNPQLYARDRGDGSLIDFISGTDNTPISSGNYARSEQISSDGWGKDYIDQPQHNSPKGITYKDAFGWVDDRNNKDTIERVFESDVLIPNPNTRDKKTLLYKTQELFKTGNMRTLISGHGDKVEKPSQINSSVSRIGSYTSKGSGVINSKFILNEPETDEDGNLIGIEPENVFCRTWTTYDRYAQVKDLQKSSGLGQVESDYDRRNTFSSVLGDNGFVKIGPYNNVENNIKNYMFSIENLAWADNLYNLLPCEIGPGDPVSGKRGRIMWFPPYDISFTETTSASWDKHNFIGRGEPMYTYNNTERTGTMQWKIIIDHPNYINILNSKDPIVNNDFIASFFAGCLSLEEMAPFLTQNELEEAIRQNNPEKDTKQDIPVTPPTSFEVYFPNDTFSVEGPYENYEDGKIRGCDEGNFEVKFIRDNQNRVIEIDYGFFADGAPNKEILNPPGDPEYLNTPGTYIWFLNEYELYQNLYNQLKSEGYFPNLPFTVGLTYFTTLDINDFDEFKIYDCDLGFNDGETLNRFNEYNNMVNLGYISLMPFNVHIPYSTSEFQILNSGTTAPFISEFTYYAEALNIDEQPIIDTYNNLYAPPLLPPQDYPWVEFLLFSGLGGNHFVPHCWKLETEDIECVINYETNPTGKGFGIGNYKEQCYKFKGSPNEGGWSTFRCSKTNGSEGREQPDRTNFGFNNIPVKVGDKEFKNWKDPEYHKALKDIFSQSKSLTMNILGYASAVGGTARNAELSKLRAEYIKNYFKENVFNDFTEEELNKRLKILAQGEGESTGSCKCEPSDNSRTDDGKLKNVNASNNDTKCCKEDRYVSVEFVDDIELKSEIDDSKKLDSQEGNLRVPDVPLSRFFSECDYFSKLSQDDPIVYGEIKDKIKYFQPAYHSTTPEGFNSRLNFLQQCMRQGPTNSVSDDGDTKTIKKTPDNLAFGRPPVCILRLGDFYYTRIIIESLSFSYDPLVWDLNPEGIGVQPMICTVDMTFNFIGGSSLNGPISKLQNAVSFNYYANTEIYEKRSDTIADKGDGTGYIVDGEKRINPEGTNARPFFKPDKNQLSDIIVDQEVKPNIPSSRTTTGQGIINDESIFRDALNKFEFLIDINYNYESPTDLEFFDGSFSLSNSNMGKLSKNYDTTLVLYTKNGYVDLVNFKIGGKDSGTSGSVSQLVIPGGGTFTSDNKKWSSTFDDAVLDKKTGEIVFGVRINEYNIIFSDIFIKPTIDCPNLSITKTSIQRLDTWSSIYENACVNCFSGSTIQPPDFLNC